MIRLLRPGDNAEWLRLRVALWPDATPQSHEIEMAAIRHGFAEQPVFVAERPDGQSGLCGLMEITIHSSAPGCFSSRIGYLEAWYVDAEFRRHGLGRQLLEAAEKWARQQGCLEMASDTDSGYPISPTAHQRLGYAIVHVSGGADGEIFFSKRL